VNLSHDDGLDAAEDDRFEYHYDVENRLAKVD
jgi:hypothetical protein